MQSGNSKKGTINVKPKIYIAKPIPKEAEAILAPLCDYKIWDQEEPIPEHTLLEEVKNVIGLITPKVKITEEFLHHAPHLKIVANVAAGYDNFDLQLMEKRSLLGTHTPYVLDETVADLAFSLILSAARRIPELDAYTKKGNWVQLDDPFFFGKDVHHSTLGIIGLGRIGEKIARRATRGFDMDVKYFNRTRRQDVEEEYGIEYREVDELLKESDFVLLMVPLTNETKQLMGKEQFALMKKDAIFINCSRGKTVDEQALIKALQEEEIRGAALDVFEIEPIETDNPLLKMKNVVTTPHIGSATKKARYDMAMKAVENMAEFLKGNPPPNVVKELKHLVK